MEADAALHEALGSGSLIGQPNRHPHRHGMDEDASRCNENCGLVEKVIQVRDLRKKKETCIAESVNALEACSGTACPAMSMAMSAPAPPHLDTHSRAHDTSLGGSGPDQNSTSISGTARFLFAKT